MATPHVAGIVALMLEANPNLSPAQVKDIIERTATNMTGRTYWEAGAGHINAYEAVAEAAGLRPHDTLVAVDGMRRFAAVVPVHLALRTDDHCVYLEHVHPCHLSLTKLLGGADAALDT